MKLSVKLDRGIATIAALVLVFLALPLAVIIPEGFSSGNYLIYPPPGFSSHWFTHFFGSSLWTTPLKTSLEVACAASVLATVIGTMSALALDGVSFRGKTIIVVLILSPLVVPLVVMGIATYGAFNAIGLEGSIPALVGAHALLGLPFVFMSVNGALGQFDRRLRSAALSLGANPFRAAREVTLPLVLPGVAAGAVLAFIVSFDDVVLATFLAGTNTQTLPMRMVTALTYEFDPTIAAVSTVLLTFGVGIFILITILERSQQRIVARGRA
jgi:putative spermidine/putrescine transport system permease protein